MQFCVDPSETGCLDIDSCSIAYATWSPSDLPPLILVHGAGAQMSWWDAVICELVDTRRLIGLDLSGHGDSGWRDSYSLQQWADEVIAVAEQVARGPALVVGHSLGGSVSIAAAARRPDVIHGSVVVDPPIRRPGNEPRRPDFRGAADRRYKSLDHAVRSFHLLPDEPVLNRELLLRVAANSFKQIDGGWLLKADNNIYGRIDAHYQAACLRQVTSPMTLVYGDRSTVLDDDGVSFSVESHSGSTTLVRIDGGFHHLTFDHAHELAQAIVATEGC